MVSFSLADESIQMVFHCERSVFSAKVVRHKEWIIFCGRLWKSICSQEEILKSKFRGIHDREYQPFAKLREGRGTHLVGDASEIKARATRLLRNRRSGIRNKSQFLLQLCPRVIYMVPRPLRFNT
jgi:hypothetical protein